MANTPISSLTSGVAIQDSNLFPDVQVVGVGPTKVTALQVKQYIGNNLTLTGTPILPQTLTIGTVNYTFPSANGAVGSVLTNNGAGVLSWNNTALGTVTSVDASGGLTGLTFSGGPIITSGQLVLGGVLGVAYGGTGATTPSAALGNLLPPISGTTAGYALFNDGIGSYYWAAAGGGGGGGGGGVSIVGSSVSGFTFLNPSTTPTLTGTLAVSNGGTGATTVAGAQANLLPSQAGQVNKFLMTNGSGVLSWQVAGGSAAGVTSVGTTLSGLTVTNATTTPSIGGTLGVTSGGTGKNVAPAAGQVLIGTSTGGYNIATLTQGPGITITSASGAITISGPTSLVTSFSAGSTGLLPSSASTGAITLTGKLNIANGGTGLSAVGPNGTTLVSNGTLLAYGNPLAATNIAGGAAGQVLYQTAASTTAFTGVGATGTYLAGNGAAAPTWNAAQTTVGTTVLTLGGTTTVLAGLTTASVTAAAITAGYPFLNEELAPKQYVDAVGSPLNRVGPVDYATTSTDGNQTLTGPATIDGTSVTDGMRVLVKDQTNMATAGIYIVNTTGSWTRSADLNDQPEFTAATTFVINGVENANTSWIQTVDPVTPDSTPQAWTKTSGLNNYLAGPGITITGGNTINNDGVLTFQCNSSMGLTPTTATNGVVTLGGVLNISNGGTSATTAVGARTNILPTQVGQTGKFLQTNGTDVVWAAPSAGSSYYIPLSSGGVTIASKILAAGWVDIAGNSYTLYNGTAAALTLTATSLPNFASFPPCTATNLVIAAGSTMCISTSVVGSTYAIDSSTYAAADNIGEVVLTGNSTMSSIITNLNFPDNIDTTYIITNNSAAAITVTATIANASAYPGYTAAGGVTIPANATATLVTTIQNSTYIVSALTNSVSTNLSGGTAGRLPYQTAANATAFTSVGTTGQLLQSNGTAAPTWVNPSSGAVFRVVTAGGAITTLLGASDKVGSINELYNSGTTALTFTGTIDNYLSYSEIATAGTIILGAKETVTIVTDVVGTNYSIMAASEASEVAGIDATGGGTIASVLTAAGITEAIGSLYSIRNTSGATITLTAIALDGFEPYAPAASSTSIILAHGESVTVLCEVVANQYQIITMSSPAISYVSASANVTTSTFLADGAVGNNGVMIYNSGTSSITVTATAFSNNLSYTNYCTGTVFTLAPKATVSIVLDGVASDTWQILSYSSAGSPIKYISLPATTPVTVAAALTTASITDAVGSEYVFYNSHSTSVVLTGTFDNALSYAANVSGTNLTVAPKQTVTLVTTTVGTNYSIVSISIDAAPKMIGYANATSYSGGATIAAILTGLGITQTPGALLTITNDDTVAWPLKTSTANDTFNNKSPLYADQVSGATPQLSIPVGATATVEVVTVDSVAGNVYAIVSISRKAAQQFNITANTNLKDYLANNALYIGDVITITNTDSSSRTLTAESFVNGASYSSAYGPVSGADTFTVVPNASVTLSLISAASSAVNGTWAIVSYSYLAVSGSGAGTVAFSAVSTGATAVGTVATYPAQVVKMPAGAFNVGNYYNNTTGKFQPLVAGYYQINAGVTTSGSANNAVNLSMFKNGAITNFVPSFSTASAGSSALSGIVYMNGSSDYLELGAYATTGYTPGTQNLYFNGALINQQTVTTNASSGNFMLTTSTSQSMTSLLAGQTPAITDLKNNIYVINNTSTTNPAVITATGFSGYQAWPQQATATSISIPASGYAEIMTTSAGTGYQIITISSSSINAGAPVAFSAVGGGAVTINSTSVYPASVMKFASVTFDNSNSYNTSTGKFQPTSAGYYQISSGVNTSGFPNNALTWLLYKNGVQTITAWDSATSAANTATISTVVYMNGTTDYLEIVSNSISGTFTPSSTSMWFSGILVNQQKVISSAVSSNFNISTGSSGTIPALIGAQTSPAITDVKDNVYIINNSGASTITLTATGLSGYQAWPTQATATSLIIPAGGYAEIITTSAGSGYQIIFMSAPFVSGSVAFAAFGPTVGVPVGTSQAYPACKISVPNVQFNPQSYYDATASRFNPKIAGYYQVNATLHNSGAVDYLWIILLKNGVEEISQSSVNPAGYGTGIALAKTVYLNGTTDYLEMGAYYGSTGAGTIAPKIDNTLKFSASLVTQQRVTSASGVNNYILSSGTSGAMSAIIASASPVITDIIGNVYAISNSGGSTINITATGFSGYTAYASYANATTMTLPVGASAVVMTTAAGSGYQIMSMSVPASAVSTTPAVFAVGNAAGTSVGVGSNVIANGYTYIPITSFTTPDPVSYLNPQNYYSNTTGKFQPLVAGYYQFTGRVSGQTSSGQYTVVIKNAFEATPATVGFDLNQGQTQSAECNGTVYLNGTTDYLVLAFRVTGGSYTITAEPLSCYFSAIAVNNQVVNAGSASTNYNLSTSVASQTVAALLAAQSPVITDVKNNVYVINNSGSTPITLTGTYSGYQAFPLSATASAITLAVGATAEIMTTTVGTGYQIVTISSPIGTVTPTNIAFNVANANNTTTLVSGGTIVDTVGGFTYYFTKIPTVDSSSYLNPQSAYSVSTGKFQPTVAGYYQINAGFTAANSYAFIAIVKNQTTWVATSLGVGGADGVVASGVVFMNGTTDYVQFAVCNGNSSTITCRSGPASAYFNGVLTTQQAVYTTTGANMNFAISASSSDTIPNLIAAQTAPTITDIKNNVYVINNTGSGQIVLSATALSGYQAFPLNSTATTITLDVGCTAEIMTTSAGTSYQIVTISTPMATASTTSIVCNVGNANASQPTMLPGTIAIGADTFNFITIGTTNVTSLLNPLNVYNTTTGKFQPTVAGYYQINGGIAVGNASYVYIALVKNGTIPLANSINGGALGMTPNAVVFLNGTTDYVQLAFSTNSNAGTTFRDRPDINYFSAALLTQQSVYVENGIKNNYNIGTSTATQTISALLAAQSPAITDVLDNVYIISNSGATPITLTATNYTGWESYSTNASATTITLPPAGFVALTTTIAGSSYQIFSMSQSFAAGSVAFRGATSASYTNNGLTAGAVLATVTGAALRTMLFTSEAATINPQAWYDPATGRYTPKVAGFYEVNFRYMFRNNSTTGTSGYVAIFKNGAVYSIAYDDTSAYCCPEVGAVIFMNGATDYLQVGASVNVGTTTLLIADGSQEWDISLSNQQTIQYANNGLSGNYSFYQNSSTSVNALIALNGVTDVLYNQYCIYNDGSADIALSDFFLGWEGFSGNATSSTVTLPAGGTLTIITIAAGGSYQIVNISLPYTAGSVAFKVKDTFAYTISGMKTVVNYDTVSFNQPAWLDPVTGSFTPQIAGYYLLSAEITKSTDGYLSSRFLFNGTDASQAVSGDNTGAGDPQSVTLSEVFYFNGTSDYAQVQVSAGTNQNVLVTYSGLLTNQVANNGQAASIRYAGARGDLTAVTSDVAVATLDNLRFGWYGATGGARQWVQAVSGTASLWGGWTIINDSGGADFLSANYDQTSAGFTTPLTVTTAKQYFTAGNFTSRISCWAIFQDSVSGNTYRVTFYLGDAYKGMQTNIERLN